MRCLLIAYLRCQTGVRDWHWLWPWKCDQSDKVMKFNCLYLGECSAHIKTHSVIFVFLLGESRKTFPSCGFEQTVRLQQMCIAAKWCKIGDLCWHSRIWLWSPDFDRHFLPLRPPCSSPKWGIQFERPKLSWNSDEMANKEKLCIEGIERYCVFCAKTVVA